MALELHTCSNEWGEVLRRVDESVHLLNHFSEENGLELVRSVSEKVDSSIDHMLHEDWIEEHQHLQEVICFLDLACFSLLRKNGEYFSVYLQELNQRYRLLLFLYFSDRKENHHKPWLS
ncbi:hypothetical protein [Hazenella coriacea]|uniref:Uncharacterized protein n=1 Tax=Hazenella coriacea TaxID=1179467 RepID=A0A4R3L9U0_9BACL|nr:hypothetical protein [Hazenella coriacea]TCS96432.1 hypothetical protein EDD58_10165 [Hazenella coriacea]